MRPLALLSLALAPALLSCAATTPPPPKPEPLRINVTVAPQLAPPEGRLAWSGRLFVLLAPAGEKPRAMIAADMMNPDKVFIASEDVAALAPGARLELAPTARMFPAPFDRAPLGAYEAIALLDPDHSYAVLGADGGDLRGPVARIELDGLNRAPIELTLDRLIEPELHPESEVVKKIRLPSVELSHYWGRAIEHRAAIALPPSYHREPDRTFASVYWVSGYGSSHEYMVRRAESVATAMAAGHIPEMIYVVISGAVSSGHHAFVDSVNNGPWSRALIRELITEVEKNYRVEKNARYLTGHSSGGWATLWLQLEYPDIFAGTWATAPDSIDFRSFSGVDLTPGSTANLFREPSGDPRYLVRNGDQWIWSYEKFSRFQSLLSDVGGPLATFEWAFSPRAADGRPLPLYNRATGELNQETLRAWEKYDLRKQLERRWPRLGPKLKGKLNVYCGALDNFRLEEATALFCASLKQLDSDAVCEVVPGKNHFDLRSSKLDDPQNLAVRIAREMEARFRAR